MYEYSLYYYLGDAVHIIGRYKADSHTHTEGVFRLYLDSNVVVSFEDRINHMFQSGNGESFVKTGGALLGWSREKRLF